LCPRIHDNDDDDECHVMLSVLRRCKLIHIMFGAEKEGKREKLENNKGEGDYVM